MDNVYKMICKNNMRELAIVDSTMSVSYKELISFCDTIHTTFSDLHKGDCVVLYGNKSVYYVSTMVAMLSMGVVYLPLDGHMPVNKAQEYAKQINAKYVFVDRQLGFDNEFLMNELTALSEISCKKMVPNDNVESDDLAYMICTSGSSGEPKIVMIENGNLLNLVTGLHDRIYCELDSIKPLHIAAVAPFSFDASVKQIYYSLCYGHTLYICEDKVKILGRKFLNFIQENHIDVIDCTPTLISLIYSDKKRIENQFLKMIICGGEKIHRKHVEEVKRIFGSNLLFFNVYGPTECCVDTSYYKIPLNEMNIESEDAIPIGVAINNVEMELADDGELIIKGAGVGRGYFGTADRGGFYTDANGERCYKTGDVCYKKNDMFYIIGRVDGQEKINGFRIEPSIVDFELSKLLSVEYSFTYATEYMKRKVLCTIIKSYVSREEILAYLKQTLPSYCVPQFIIFTDKELILNKNGKTDMTFYKKMGDVYLSDKYNNEVGLE